MMAKKHSPEVLPIVNILLGVVVYYYDI